MDKCSFQKMYEKFAMITKFSEGFQVMLARQEDGTPGLFLCIDSTPLAMLLPRKEIQKYKADHGLSKIIQEVFDSALSKDDRKTLDDFHGQGPEGMRKMFKEVADAMSKEHTLL